MSFPQLPYRSQPPVEEPYPVVIDARTGYPIPAAYPAPPPVYHRPTDPRRPLSQRLVLAGFFVMIGVVALACLKIQPWMADAGVPPWWAGSWVTDSGEDVPRLDVQLSGPHVRGQLLVAYNPGYLASLPFTGDAVGDSLLFCVQEQAPAAANLRQTRGLSYYLLRWQGPDLCHLYRLADPPANRPYSTGLIPRSLDTEHTFVARLTRPFPGAALRPAPPPAPPAPAQPKEGARAP